jgi:hypothetical protein
MSYARVNANVIHKYANMPLLKGQYSRGTYAIGHCLKQALALTFREGAAKAMQRSN